MEANGGLLGAAPTHSWKSRSADVTYLQTYKQKPCLGSDEFTKCNAAEGGSLRIWSGAPLAQSTS